MLEVVADGTAPEPWATKRKVWPGAGGGGAGLAASDCTGGGAAHARTALERVPASGRSPLLRPQADLQLLCPSGGCKPLEEFESCNIAKAPAYAGAAGWLGRAGAGCHSSTACMHHACSACSVPVRRFPQACGRLTCARPAPGCLPHPRAVMGRSDFRTSPLGQATQDALVAAGNNATWLAGVKGINGIDGFAFSEDTQGVLVRLAAGAARWCMVPLRVPACICPSAELPRPSQPDPCPCRHPCRMFVSCAAGRRLPLHSVPGHHHQGRL